MLEELLEMGIQGAEYDAFVINIIEGDQFGSGFVEINPNSKIPALVDYSVEKPQRVFESGAILWYLAEKYNVFLPHSADERSKTLQWLMFQMAGIGPMMGQAMYFQRIAAKNGEINDFSINRYVNESRRLFEVLDNQLRDHDYIVGDEFTIADIATYPWARAYYWANVSVDGLENLQAWFNRIDQREATQRALEIPKPFWAFFGKGDVEAQERENAERFKSDVK